MMKKFLCIMFAGLLLLSGCAEPEEKTTVCKVDLEGMSEEMTLTALEDEVLSIKSVLNLPFSLYGIVTEEEKEMFVEQMLASFQYEGMTAESKSTDEEFILELNITLSEVDYANLVALGMMSEEDAATDMVSLEKTVEGLTGGGYTCE